MVWEVRNFLWHDLKSRLDSQVTANRIVSPRCLALDHFCSFALVACVIRLRVVGGPDEVEYLNHPFLKTRMTRARDKSYFFLDCDCGMSFERISRTHSFVP